MKDLTDILVDYMIFIANGCDILDSWFTVPGLTWIRLQGVLIATWIAIRLIGDVTDETHIKGS
jgi:hypothetical protein